MVPHGLLDGANPGDVLLFRSTGCLSRVIQTLGDAPVSHAALVVSQGERKIILNATWAMGGAPPDESGISELPVEAICDPEAGIERVLILRHRNATETNVKSVVNRAEWYRGQGVRFDQGALLLLGAIALGCEYRPSLADLELIWTCIRPLWRSPTPLGAMRSDAELTPGAERHTCSEYVYRCFEESGHPPLAIETPLGRTPPDPVPELMSIESALSRRLEADREGSTAGVGREVIRLLELFVEAIRNRQRHLDEAARVTPGDLMRSPSFNRVEAWNCPQV